MRRTRCQKDADEQRRRYGLREGGLPLRRAGLPVVDALAELAAGAVSHKSADVARRHGNNGVCAGAALGREPLRRVVRARRVGRLRQRAPILSRARDARGGEFAIGAPPRPLVRATLSTRAIYTQAFSLPPWPEDKSPWRYLLRCRSSSLQDLSSSGTLLY